MVSVSAPSVQRLPFARYAAIEAEHWSVLSEIWTSPLAYLHATRTPVVETEAMRLGSAVHCAILEPDEYPRRYVRATPDFWTDRSLNRSTKEGKARWLEWLASHPGYPVDAEPDQWKRDVFLEGNPGRALMDDAEHARCLAIRDAVRAHPAAAALLADGLAETVLTWTDEVTGLPCKGRVDWLPSDRPVVVEVKTTRSVDARFFASEVATRLYHGQLAFYEDGLAAHGTELDAPMILAVENEPPFDVGVFQLPPAAIVAGHALARACLDRVAECRALGRWPGRYPDETLLDLPRWALADVDAWLPLDALDGALD